jgi:hypothetical protein
MLDASFECRALVWKGLAGICPLCEVFLTSGWRIEASGQADPLRGMKRRAMLATRLPTERTMPRKNQYASGAFIPGQRPAPPDDMTAEELELWMQLTSNLPAERIDAWFMIMVRPLIRHIRYAKWLGELIDTMMRPDAPPTDPTRRMLRQLLTAHSAETGRMADLMGKLRLLPVNRYYKDSAALRPQTGPEPWNDWGNRAHDRSDN